MTHLEFRPDMTNKMMHDVQQETIIGRVITAAFSMHSNCEKINILKHIENLSGGCRDGMVPLEQWGTETEMVALTLLYGIRVRCINNTSFKAIFSFSDSEVKVRLAAAAANIANICDSLPMLKVGMKTINLFFHKCGSPMTPARADQLNHFCLLLPQEKVPTDQEPYCGFHCPTPQEEKVTSAPITGPITLSVHYRKLVMRSKLNILYFKPIVSQ